MPTLAERIHNAQDTATLQVLLDQYKQYSSDLSALSIPAWYEYGFQSLKAFEQFTDDVLYIEDMKAVSMH